MGAARLVGMNKSGSLLKVEPLHGSDLHDPSPQAVMWAQMLREVLEPFVEASAVGDGGAIDWFKERAMRKAKFEWTV